MRADAGIDLIERAAAEPDEAGHDEGPIDPHYWLDAGNGIKIAATVRRPRLERRQGRLLRRPWD